MVKYFLFNLFSLYAQGPVTPPELPLSSPHLREEDFLKRELKEIHSLKSQAKDTPLLKRILELEKHLSFLKTLSKERQAAPMLSIQQEIILLQTILKK